MSEPRRWIHDFSDPAPDGVDDAAMVALLGGKGASLKRMTLAGLNVPPGFTISTEACRHYDEHGRAWPPGLEDELRAAMGRLETATGRRFGAGARPLLVSVRSGAAVSMPGMMDTLLNCGLHPDLAGDVGDTPVFWQLYIDFVLMFAKTVHGLDASHWDHFGPGPTGEPAGRDMAAQVLEGYRELSGTVFPTDAWSALTECINAVFDSWHNPRAIAYRKRNDITGLPGTAVNVQVMFPSDVSGIVFTQDPNDVDANRMVIEASYGLGEAVVSGDVTPDLFLVRRDTREVESRIGRKHCMVAALGSSGPPGAPDAPSLDRRRLDELIELALRVETYFGHPVDIEFGLAEGRFALLQSRRIRGLDVAQDVEVAREEEIFRLRETCADGRHRCWIVHNLGETLRFPTPLTWDIVRDFMRGDGGFGRMYQQLGYRPSERARVEGFLDLIGGRIYADPERLAGLFWGAMPLRYDLDELLRDRALLDRAPTAFDPDRADGDFLLHLPATAWALVRSSRLAARQRAGARRIFEQEILPPYLAYVRQARAMDLDGLADADLLRELHARRERVLQTFAPASLLPGYFGGMALAGLEQQLAQIMGPEKGRELAMTLTRALDGDTTFEQDAMLHDVAAGKSTLEAFLDRFGHRAVNEMELAAPRWREDPSYLQKTIARLQGHLDAARTPHAMHAENLRQRRAAEDALPGLLQRWGASSMREPLEKDLHDAQALLPYRESGKHYLMMGYELIRLCLEALARRWNLGSRLYYLHLSELDAFAANREQALERIRQRRIRWEALQRLDLPDVIDSAQLEGLGLPQERAAGGELTGTPVAAGVAVGTVRIVFDPAAAGDLGEDGILVCPSTDPGWTPLFMDARGLVVERGGVLSHGAIVARDFGIPAVVCENATKLLREGQRIRLDGNRGVIGIEE